MISEILALSRNDIVRLGIGMAEVISAVEGALVQQASGAVEMPDKVQVHWEKEKSLTGMPGYVPAAKALGIKWVGTAAMNPDRGFPQTSATIILNDPGTALPVAFMDGTWVTAMRTGAVSAVSAKYLALPDAEVLTLIGCGVQMRTQVMALSNVLKPKVVRALDASVSVADRFVRDMESLLEAEWQTPESIEEAVVGSDVVVTATRLVVPPVPIIKRSWLKPGLLALPIDVQGIWEPSTYLDTDKFICDRWSSLEHFAEIGGFPQGLPKLYAELHEIACGRKPGRENGAERIMAMNTGMAIEDVVTSMLVYERAKEEGIGTKLPFIESLQELWRF